MSGASVPEAGVPSAIVATRRTVRAAQTAIIALLPADWTFLGPTHIPDGTWIVGVAPTGPRRDDFSAVVAHDLNIEAAMDKLEAAVRKLDLSPRRVN
jgi:hypothetical protein